MIQTMMTTSLPLSTLVSLASLVPPPSFYLLPNSPRRNSTPLKCSLSTSTTTVLPHPRQTTFTRAINHPTSPLLPVLHAQSPINPSGPTPRPQVRSSTIPTYVPANKQPSSPMNEPWSSTAPTPKRRRIPICSSNLPSSWSTLPRPSPFPNSHRPT